MKKTHRRCDLILPENTTCIGVNQGPNTNLKTTWKNMMFTAKVSHLHATSLTIKKAQITIAFYLPLVQLFWMLKNQIEGINLQMVHL